MSGRRPRRPGVSMTQVLPFRTRQRACGRRMAATRIVARDCARRLQLPRRRACSSASTFRRRTNRAARLSFPHQDRARSACAAVAEVASTAAPPRTSSGIPRAQRFHARRCRRTAQSSFRKARSTARFRPAAPARDNRLDAGADEVRRRGPHQEKRAIELCTIRLARGHPARAGPVGSAADALGQPGSTVAIGAHGGPSRRPRVCQPQRQSAARRHGARG